MRLRAIGLNLFILTSLVPCFAAGGEVVTRDFANSIAHRLMMNPVDCGDVERLMRKQDNYMYCFTHAFQSFAEFKAAWDQGAEWEDVFAPNPVADAAAAAQSTSVDSWASPTRARRAAGDDLPFDTFERTYFMNASRWGFVGDVVVSVLIGESFAAQRNIVKLIFWNSPEQGGTSTSPFGTYGSTPTVKYWTSDDSGPKALYAKLNGHTFEIGRAGEYELLAIALVADFDGDGLEDVLFSQGTMGNCCVPSSYITSIYTDYSTVTVEVPDNPNQVEFSDGRFRATYFDSYREFTYERGKLTVISDRDKAAITAVVEVRIEDDDPTARVDIDGDGVPELLECGVVRAGVICDVILADGTPVPLGHLICTRVGQLDTRTNGYSDFVCNQNTVLKWDGHEYSDVN